MFKSVFDKEKLFHSTAISAISTLSVIGIITGANAQTVEPNQLPTGENTISGSVDYDRTTANSIVVNQKSDRAIIEWDTFDIGHDARTEFVQPGQQSVAVSRVLDANPSRIMGQLTSNGRLVLLNPNGVMFGVNSKVDVGGMIVSTGQIDDQQFIDKGIININNIDQISDATIENEGAITVSDGGLVAFVAPNMTNSGVIQANLGTVQLASGKTATVDFYGDGLLEMEVTEPLNNTRLEHTGNIQANGGQVLLSVAAAMDVVDNLLNLDGIVEARHATMKNDRIVLSAEKAPVQVSSKGHLDSNTVEMISDDLTIDGQVVADAGTFLLSRASQGDVFLGDGENGLHLSNDELAHITADNFVIQDIQFGRNRGSIEDIVVENVRMDYSNITLDTNLKTLQNDHVLFRGDNTVDGMVTALAEDDIKVKGGVTTVNGNVYLESNTNDGGLGNLMVHADGILDVGGDVLFKTSDTVVDGYTRADHIIVDGTVITRGNDFTSQGGVFNAIGDGDDMPRIDTRGGDGIIDIQNVNVWRASSDLFFSDRGINLTVNKMNDSRGFKSIDMAVDSIGNTTDLNLIDIFPGDYQEKITITTDNIALNGGGNVKLSGDGTGNGIDIGANNIQLSGINIDGFDSGLNIDQKINNLSINNITAINNKFGMRVDTNGDISFGNNTLNGQFTEGLMITDSQFDNNVFAGMAFLASDNLNTVQDVTLSNLSFNKNGVKGFYAEKLSHANLIGINVNDTGMLDGMAFDGIRRTGIEINLQNGDHQAITLDNVTVEGSARNFTNLSNGQPVTGTGILVNADTGANLNGLILTNSNITAAQNDTGEFIGTNGLELSGNLDDITIGQRRNGNTLTGPRAVFIQDVNQDQMTSTGIRIEGNNLSSANLLNGNRLDQAGISIKDSNINLGIFDNDISPDGFTFDHGVLIENSAGVDLLGNNISGALFYGVTARGDYNGLIQLTDNRVNSQFAIEAMRFESGQIDFQGGGNLINNVSNGLIFDHNLTTDGLNGGGLSIVGNSISDTTFNFVLGNYVKLENGALYEPGTPTLINASEATFDFADTSDPGDWSLIESGIIDFDDGQNVGQVTFDDNLF
jgi:filamentous hemagglutinin family protein